MPRQNSPRTALAKLLEAAPLPIYAIDGQRRIVFCNSAAASWIGVAVEGLVGRRVAYHSSDSLQSEGGIAAGLCPPPSVFAGQSVRGHVSSLTSEGILVYRTAEFVPLALEPGADELGLDQSETSGGVVVFLGATDLQSSDLIASSEPHDLHRQIREARRQWADLYQIAALVGDSLPAQKFRRQANVAAKSGGSAILTGPSGSGKEYTAKAIYYARGDNASCRLATIDAEALDEELLEWTCKPLLSESPQPLTIILEQLDQLDPAAQSKLVEMFEASRGPLQVLATTAFQLDSLREQQKLAPALDSFLTGLVLELPPLRNRLEDLPAIAQVMLEQVNAQAGERQVEGFREETLDQMRLYEWPRNLDELREVVAAAHRAARSPWLRPEDLPTLLHHAVTDAVLPSRQVEPINLDEHLAEIERELIEEALQRAKGNKAQAARLLGLTRPKLYRRLENLGMADEPA